MSDLSVHQEPHLDDVRSVSYQPTEQKADDEKAGYVDETTVAERGRTVGIDISNKRARRHQRAERALCFGLHSLLILIYIFLVFLARAPYTWTYPKVGTFVDDDSNPLSSPIYYVTFALSTGPQFVGTIYMAVLAASTQKIALHRSLLTEQTLTTTHDMANAWFGLGASAMTLWKQFTVASSVLGVMLVATYLGFILLFHTFTASLLSTFYNSSDPNDPNSDKIDVYVYVNTESSVIGLVLSIILLLLAWRLIGTRSNKIDDAIDSVGILEVIRLVHDKPEVQRHIAEAEDSSAPCLRKAGQEILVTLTGADAKPQPVKRK